MRLCCRLVFILLTVPPVIEARRTAPEELSFEQYRELIQLYRSGSFQWAVEALSDAPPEVVERFASRLGEFTNEKGAQFPGLSLSSMDLKAAVLLHTQVAVMKSNQRKDAIQQVHWEAAGVIAKGVKDSAFRRDWLIARGYFHQTRLEAAQAVAVLRTALSESPNDSEILLALGTVHEALGSSMMRRLDSNTLFRPHRTTAEDKALRRQRYFQAGVNSNLESSQDYYEKALRLAPELIEAHLRLGRVLQLRGRSSDALARFDWVLEHAREPADLCLAHVFCGRVHEQEGRPDEAVEHYRAAVGVRDDWQLALIALSHALHLTGDFQGSVSALNKGLKIPTDPFYHGGGLWDYLLQRDEFVNRIQRLREDVIQ